MTLAFMIDFLIFKLSKQMPAKELKQCAHFSSPSINAVYIALFRSPGDIRKASPNALQSTYTICITQLELQHDFHRACCVFRPPPLHSPLLALIFFYLTWRTRWMTFLSPTLLFKQTGANEKRVLEILLLLLVWVISERTVWWYGNVKTCRVILLSLHFFFLIHT